MVRFLAGGDRLVRPLSDWTRMQVDREPVKQPARLSAHLEVAEPGVVLWSTDGMRRWAIVEADGSVGEWVCMHGAMRLRRSDRRASLVHVPMELEGVVIRRRGMRRQWWEAGDGELRRRQPRLEREYAESLEGSFY